MSSPFVAEIRIFAGNFAPTGWATCDGQILPISQNTALFSLLGTTYGGNGQSTFALPNLQGSAPMHAGQGQRAKRTLSWRAERRASCDPPGDGDACSLARGAGDQRQQSGHTRSQCLVDYWYDQNATGTL